MKNALWFSRHTPTAEQLKEIESYHDCKLVAISEGQELGSTPIVTEEDANMVIQKLKELASVFNARVVYGVFPTPVLGVMAVKSTDALRWSPWEDNDINCYAAWNVQRSSEGGKPTFEHKKWIWVGCL